MPDESAAAESQEQLENDLHKSRESASQLLESLARKIGASRAVHSAATGFERAALYVQYGTVKNLAAGVGRLVRKRPIYSIAAAVVAGVLCGKALRMQRRSRRSWR
jgi:ElaB/YqjD/DUF883 family membrane-anchored ribosome-binding protein